MQARMRISAAYQTTWRAIRPRTSVAACGTMVPSSRRRVATKSQNRGTTNATTYASFAFHSQIEFSSPTRSTISQSWWTTTKMTTSAA
jgi:hypothetical protein